MTNLKSKLALLLSTVLTFLSNPIAVIAKPLNPCTQIGGCVEGIKSYESTNGVVGGRNAIVTFILDISRILTYISAAVAVIIIIFAGYKMLVSNGNEEQFKKGKNTLIYAVIGLIVIICAGTIVTLISGISGFRLS